MWKPLGSDTKRAEACEDMVRQKAGKIQGDEDTPKQVAKTKAKSHRMWQPDCDAIQEIDDEDAEWLRLHHLQHSPACGRGTGKQQITNNMKEDVDEVLTKAVKPWEKETKWKEQAEINPQMCPPDVMPRRVVCEVDIEP